MDRIARQTCSHFLTGFEAEEDGTSTIEFVVLLPLFIMFLMVMTNTNLSSLRQSTLVGDTARIVSGPAMPPPEAGIFSDFTTIAAMPPAATEAVVVSLFDAVADAGNSIAPVSFAVTGSAGDEGTTVSGTSLVEPSR